jgi:hypothetical protein
MTKFHGKLGYGKAVETEAGVWEDRIEERSYFGDVVRNTRRLQNGETLHDNLSFGNSISIVSDAYADKNFYEIRYIEWAGTLWVVSDVEVQPPRLILRLGGVYHGPTPRSSEGS